MLTINGIGYVGSVTITEYQGKEVLNLNVAHTTKYKTDNKTVEKTEWVKCVKWYNEKIPEKLKEYLVKGVLVYYTGSPSAQFFSNEKKETIANIEVKLDKFEILKFKEKEN